MSDQGFTILYRFRYFFCGLLVVASLLILSLLLSVIGNNQAQASASGTSSAQNSGTADNANIITDGFEAALNSASRATTAVASAVQGINNGVMRASASAITATTTSGEFVARNTYGAVLLAAHGAGKGADIVVQAPVYVWHGVSNIEHIGSLIKPSESDNTKVPQIDPAIAQEITDSKPAAAAYPAVTQNDQTTQWPIKGYITEEFGVPHWPWQPTHTGIDVSDGAAPGVTPIRPFEPGRVIVVIHSNAGFGNHVIIDHGGGLTSLYGHMYATSVQVGQVVDKNTVLGYEGSTGESTGVHVHFEIDLNNTPVNPHLYVAGNPS